MLWFRYVLRVERGLAVRRECRHLAVDVCRPAGCVPAGLAPACCAPARLAPAGLAPTRLRPRSAAREVAGPARGVEHLLAGQRVVRDELVQALVRVRRIV